MLVNDVWVNDGDIGGGISLLFAAITTRGIVALRIGVGLGECSKKFGKGDMYVDSVRDPHLADRSNKVCLNDD